MQRTPNVLTALASLALFSVLPAAAFFGQSYSETFENKTSLTQTSISALPGSTSTPITSNAIGQQDLVLNPDSAVTVPVALGSSYELSFSLERTAGVGTFLLDPDDRSGQHGFSRVLLVSPSGTVTFNGTVLTHNVGSSGTVGFVLHWTETGSNPPSTWQLDIIEGSSTSSYYATPPTPTSVPPAMDFGHVGPGSAAILVHEIAWQSY